MTDNYDEVDVEIRDIVRYLNSFEGIETTESCFGHNEMPCQIWFRAKSIKALNDLVFEVFDGDRLWKITVDNADFPQDTNDLRLLLSSGEIKDFPTVNLMVENLTYRLQKKYKHIGGGSKDDFFRTN